MDAKTAWTNICSIVTKSGSGNPKCSGANIHLLYKDNNSARTNLYDGIDLEKMQTDHKSRRTMTL